MTETILFISPHADDEILATGGVIDKFTKEGKKCHVFYIGIDESDAGSERPTREKRIEEVKAVADFLKFDFTINEKNIVNNYNERDLIKQFEEIIQTLKPSMVFIPFPSYNQDHRAAFHAALVALRPHDRNHFVKKVLVYEQPHVVMWDYKQNTPAYYVPIDIERKLQAYNLYQTQVRGMRPPEILKALAKVRGTSVNVPYAEAFQIYRWVD